MIQNKLSLTASIIPKYDITYYRPCVCWIIPLHLSSGPVMGKINVGAWVTSAEYVELCSGPPRVRDQSNINTEI